MTEAINQIPLEERVRIMREVLSRARIDNQNSEKSLVSQIPAFYEDRQMEGVEVIVGRLSELGINRRVLIAVDEVLKIIMGETRYNHGGIYLPNGQKLDFSLPLHDYYYANIVGKPEEEK